MENDNLKNKLNAKNVVEVLKLSGEGFLNSYAQVFFSKDKVLATVLVLVSFFDFGAGLSGVIAILIGQLTAYLFNFNREYIRDGMYTYNSVMVGIAVGIFYEFTLPLLTLLIIISILTFFLTIWFSVSLAKKGLPFLSIPFLIAIWVVILGTDNFSAFALKQKELLSLVKYFPEAFNGTTDFIGQLPFANVIYLYLRSLGAIFFQYNDLAGLLIAIGILFYSRIGFVLSIFGFLIGYLFYYFMEGDFSQLVYSYIGFNFILTAIALGGFFLVPSRRSFVLLLFTIPIIALLLSSLHTLFSYFELPLYSLPFNLAVLLLLSSMAVRMKAKGLFLVTVQQYSPEKNHYKFYNSMDRFGSDTYYHLSLPIMGEWNVSQGYNGDITHKKEWRHALDFDIRDEEDQSYRKPGNHVEEYYCYDLPVIAPAKGTIVEIVDGVKDNLIGEVDLKNNWGNVIIIKHGDFIYTKLSHLKIDTIKVKVGDAVKKGDVLAFSGSSGRSPEPHLHFQVQATAHVGSKTFAYPFSYYLSKEEDGFTFHSFDVPKEGEIVRNVATHKLLSKAFTFTPGEIMNFKIEGDGSVKNVKWEVFTTVANQTYIYCHESKSTAYFINNGTVFYFTDFYGDKSSFLHSFYLGAHKVLLGYYKGIELKDKLLIDSFFSPVVKIIHDFTAPFFHYLSANYRFTFSEADDEHNPSKVVFNSACSGKLFTRESKKMDFEFTIEDQRISTIVMKTNDTKIIAKCID